MMKHYDSAHRTDTTLFANNADCGSPAFTLD